MKHNYVYSMFHRGLAWSLTNFLALGESSWAFLFKTGWESFFIMLGSCLFDEPFKLKVDIILLIYTKLVIIRKVSRLNSFHLASSILFFSMFFIYHIYLFRLNVLFPVTSKEQTADSESR